MADKHDLNRYKPTFAVPADAQRFLTSEKVQVCDNFSLLLHRYLPHEAIKGDQLVNDRGRPEKTVRVWWLEKILRRFSLDDSDASASKDFQATYVASTARWNARTRGAKRFPLILTSRMIVGLGGKGPLEIGLTVDHLTGLPYIPGSALKGLTRSYALYLIAEAMGKTLVGDESDNHTLEALDEALMAGEYDQQNPMYPLYRVLFGSREKAGQAVFHDAILNGAPGAVYGLDVMTPHFKAWYNSGNNSKGRPTDYPHDADEPNPVVFIAVNAGCQFAFAVGWRGEDNTEAHQFARELLETALQEFGVGSKTAAGYGAFTTVKKK